VNPEVIRGTLHLFRATTPRFDADGREVGCVCCLDQPFHITGLGVSGPDGYGIDFDKAIWLALYKDRVALEGKRIRVTIEVDPDELP